MLKSVTRIKINENQKWFNSVDPVAAAKITVAKSRLELGNTSNVKWFKGIGEYKIDWDLDIVFI